jgi:hypothetical protein
MNLQAFLVGSFATKLVSTTVLIIIVLIIRKYIVHWEKAEKALLQAARDVSLPCIDKAGRVMKA